MKGNPSFTFGPFQSSKSHANPPALDHPVAAWLRKNTQCIDKVLVWGAQLAFNVISQRKDPSAILFYPLLVNLPISAGLADRFVPTSSKINPSSSWIHAINQDLLPANIDAVYAFIAENYRLETSIGDYQIYRLVTP
jgi:hypothetical protein